MESVEDVLVGDAGKARRRVGPGGERGGGSGHGYLGV